MTETALKTRVTQALRTEYPGLWYYKASDRWQSGIPDILGCYHSQLFAIELKVKPNGSTKMQDYILGRIREAGGIAGVCYSVGDVRMLLKRTKGGETK
jgi:hypothetical protein